MELLDHHALQHMDSLAVHSSDSSRHTDLYSPSNPVNLARRHSHSLVDYHPNKHHHHLNGQHIYSTSVIAPVSVSRLPQDALSWEFAATDDSLLHVSSSLLASQDAYQERSNINRRGSHASMKSQASHVSSPADMGIYQSLSRSGGGMDHRALSHFCEGATAQSENGDDTDTNSLHRSGTASHLPAGSRPSSSIKQSVLGKNTVNTAQINGPPAAPGSFSHGGSPQDITTVSNSASISASASASASLSSRVTANQSLFLLPNDMRSELAVTTDVPPIEHIQSASSQTQSVYQPNLPSYNFYGNLKRREIPIGVSSNLLNPETAISGYVQNPQGQLPSTSQMMLDTHRGLTSQGVSPISPNNINVPTLHASAATDYVRDATSDSSQLYLDAMLLDAQHVQQQQLSQQPQSVPNHFQPDAHHPPSTHCQSSQTLHGAHHPQQKVPHRYSDYVPKMTDRIDNTHPHSSSDADITYSGSRIDPKVGQVSRATLHSWGRLAARPHQDDTANAILRPHITQYLESTNKLMLGERTIIVMTTTVGQKSYGTERRFLVPPPSAFILGCSWWTHLPDAYVAQTQRPQHHNSQSCMQLFPSSIKIALSHDLRSSKDVSLEWTTISGANTDMVGTAEDFPIAGRISAKQLFIPDLTRAMKKAKNKSALGRYARSDSDMEESISKKVSVQAAVKLFSPGLGPETDRLVGTFMSKPIKIISKPSKKLQNVSQNLSQYVTHGCTVALFNRLRSQSVSTRFLCVSSPAANFPQWDWQLMTGQDEKPFVQDQRSSFIARTMAWDSFVLYAVDPTKSAHSDNDNSQPAPQLGFPQAPANALPVPTSGCPVVIHYNQPVVLQCVNTAVVSPVMVIRKVEKGNLACGTSTPSSQASQPTYTVPLAPGEVLGVPVAQLHRIAFEIIPDCQEAYNTPFNAVDGFAGAGSYLACLGENVGIRKSETSRMPCTPNGSPNIDAETPSSEDTDPFDARGFSNNSPSRTDSLGIENATGHSNDGGKVKKTRRSSNSTASLMMGPNRDRKPAESTGSLLAEAFEPTHQQWQQDAGEAGCWTIATTEIARHTFYIPPILFDGLVPYKCKASGCPDCFITPIPAAPVSNLPSIKRYLPSQTGGQSLRGSQKDSVHVQKTITLYGENFTPDWSVWFGDIPSPGRIPSECVDTLECLIPVSDIQDDSTPRHLLLVRSDGLIVPSRVYWTPA